MKQVYVLFRRIYDPYGCLEDNESDIVGIFDNQELADKYKKEKEEKNKIRNFYDTNFEYWVDIYNINKIYK